MTKKNITKSTATLEHRWKRFGHTCWRRGQWTRWNGGLWRKVSEDFCSNHNKNSVVFTYIYNHLFDIYIYNISMTYKWFVGNFEGTIPWNTPHCCIICLMLGAWEEGRVEGRRVLVYASELYQYHSEFRSQKSIFQLHRCFVSLWGRTSFHKKKNTISLSKAEYPNRLLKLNWFRLMKYFRFYPADMVLALKKLL